MPNHLDAETSAYLRQHRHNPVDWYPWGPEPFERARRERKPVLVSIGYASCHWCHVMERESFEDPETAALMNERLVSIKVDREERPDVDQIYMETVVRLTGSGGWPLNVFCTPDGRPFFGGTYFPPEPAYGRPSWRQVVEAVARSAREQPDQVEEQAARILEALRARPAAPASEAPGLDALSAFCRDLMQGADERHGGFGGAPKFPTPTSLEAVLSAAHQRAAVAGALDHVVFTLHRMARGGIYDQLGGGFHRYSTDAAWLVPHFEKMLYDQGQLLRVYAGAFQLTGDAELEWPVLETIAFMERELRSPEGGFWSSIDADSEGEEGRFYVWTRPQLEQVLGAADAESFASAYGVLPGGNFERTGASVLSHAMAGDRPRFAAERARLLAARAARARPETDPKQIAAWVGYAIGGLATAGSAFGQPEWVAAAARAADFVIERLWDAEEGLLRIWDGGRARIPAFLDDHAAVLCALLDLHRAGGGDRYLEAALPLGDALCARFWDAAEGALYFAPAGGDPLFVRPHSDHDGATPAAAGLAALALVRLAELSGRADLRAVAEGAVARDGPLALRQPLGFPTLLRAAALLERGLGLGLILGAPEDAATRALAGRARALLSADDAVIVAAPGKRPAWLAPHWLEGREPSGGRPTAYLCRGRVCSLPANDPADLALPPTG